MNLKPTTRALLLVKNHEIHTPEQFARLMWPDSQAWSNRDRCGRNGVSYGRMIKMSGAAFLGRLRKIGLISNCYPCRLTTAGEKHLEGNLPK